MTESNLSRINEEMAAAVRAAEAGVVRINTDRGTTASGCVFAPDLVITSSAELGRGEPVQVTDATQNSVRAELIGRDPGYDLAVLRVSGGALTPLAFADPTGLAVGQLALALGRPGRAVRASLRIIGLLSDDVETPAGARLSRYIESDRGFPQGFAGGPLIDAQGRALGMNTERLIRGADLAVPRDALERSVEQLVAHGSVARGYIGVAAQPVRLPSPLRERLGRRSGALVLAVEEGSPAARAGIMFGDTLISLAGSPLSGPRELVARLRDRVGQNVDLELVRAGEVVKVTLVPSQRGAPASSE